MLLLSFFLLGAALIGLVALLRFVIDQKGAALLRHSTEQDLTIARKYNPVRIDRFRPFLLNVGLLVSMALALMAFEWETVDGADLDEQMPRQTTAETVIEVPILYTAPPPPPEMRQAVQNNSADIQEVENEINIPDLEINFEDRQNDIPDLIGTVMTVAPPVREEPSDEVWTHVENPAIFPGGMDKFYEYLRKNLVYPKDARRIGIEGKVFISFVVDKDGSLSDITIAKGIASPSCNEEALRVIKASPHWQPAKQRGKPVRYRMTVPISFKLAKQ
jgi:periplasmic protein TonB